MMNQEQKLKPEHLRLIPVMDMTPEQLSWAYAKKRGMKYILIYDGCIGYWNRTGGDYNGSTHWQNYRPHSDWQYLGQRIDDEDILLISGLGNGMRHGAVPNGKNEYISFGETKLIAALRCLLLIELSNSFAMEVPTMEFIRLTKERE